MLKYPKTFLFQVFAVLLFTIGFINPVSSQNTEFMEDYSAISIKVGLSRYIGIYNSHYRSDLYYNFDNFTTPVVGMEYDFLRWNNFNFKTGLFATYIMEKEKLFFSQEETDFGYDLEEWIITTTEGMWRLSVPLTAEYLWRTEFGTLTFNTGFILGYHNEFGEAFTEYDTATTDGEQRLNYKSVYSRYSEPWYFNGQIGVGIYFPFKGWMLRTNFFYNQAFQKLYEGEYEFTHLLKSPDFKGTYGFKGNSYGVEMSIYFGKGKKKNKN